MSNTQLTPAQKSRQIKDFFDKPAVQAKMRELVDKNAASFGTSIMQIVNSNAMLLDAEPMSIFNAACMAATLNLPINNNLGFAYIVPFRNKKTGTTEAQFQLGYKGFIQLAQRSGQFKRINACAVYDQDSEEDVHRRLTSLIPTKPQGTVIGYIAYFQLLNGYEANLTMTLEELEAHAKQYSQTYKRGYGVWADNFEAMARKTVIKLLLSQQAPLSIDMQKAVLSDQAVIKDIEAQQFDYIDNQPSDPVMLLPVDDTLFATLKENISTGEISVESVLNGNYDLTDEQRAEIESL
ncbi:recombinase RecT [Neisseria elongata]|uniref:recombinase RecT n=1 Tax=Neisseria elongata TaxID=495 RepID=UPI0006685EBA|nr:recombinase RecT [Neisseria elongata]